MIFLLSETNQLNAQLRERLLSEIQSRGNKIAYISSEPQNIKRNFFEVTKNDYAAIDSRISLEYFDLSDNFNDQTLQTILDFEIVHLSGGNTYTFLESLRKRNLKEIIKKILDHDGLIIGVSAGAIALTPHIGTSELCGDINVLNLNDFSGLNFVEFCFLPHFESFFQNTSGNLDRMKTFSQEVGRELYICRDSDGISVNSSGEVAIYGNIQKTCDGQL